MKKLILFLLFSFVLPLASASQWGALYDYEGEDASSKAGENYLLRHFIEGKKIYIDLDVEEKDTKNIAKYKKMIDQAFWDWISYPMDLIREQGREAEFADLNDVYGKGLSIEFGQPKQGKSDLRIYVRSTMDVMVRCRSTGCYIFEGEYVSVPEIWLSRNHWLFRLVSGNLQNIKRTAVHEIGHALGLSDQYEVARTENSHPLYSSTQVPEKTIMDRAKKLTCDDADGIINLIDITRGTSRGGQRGWKSLCRNSQEYYVNGIPVSKGPYIISNNEMLDWTVTHYVKGKKMSEQKLALNLEKGISPFKQVAETVEKRDNLGRPVLASGPNGTKIYYSYSFEKTTRIIVKDKTVLQATVTSMVGKNDYPRMTKMVASGEGGNLVFIRKIPPAGRKESEVFYVKEDAQGKELESVRLRFNRKGALVQEEWNGNTVFVERKGKNLVSPMAAETSSFLMGQALGRSVSQQREDNRKQKLRQELTNWLFEKEK